MTVACCCACICFQLPASKYVIGGPTAATDEVTTTRLMLAWHRHQTTQTRVPEILVTETEGLARCLHDRLKEKDGKTTPQLVLHLWKLHLARPLYPLLQVQ